MFWKTKKYRLNKEFQFHNFEDSDLTGVEILKGKYSGILYYYTYASITEELGMGKLKFGYHVVNCDKNKRELLEKDSEFVIMLGDILSELILTETKIDPTRTIYSEESSL